MTKFMWIPACNETNLQADTQWKGKGTRETTLSIKGFKPKTTKSSPCRSAFCFSDCGMGPLSVYRVSHCPTFSVNSLWIIGVCYGGMLVSVGQSHDISLWSILSLGNRSINVEMICKLRVFGINWCLITLIIYVQTNINQRCMYASLGLRMLTHGGQDKMAAIFLTNQIAKFMGRTWGPPWSCRPQLGPILDPWTLLSGDIFK